MKSFVKLIFALSIVGLFVAFQNTLFAQVFRQQNPPPAPVEQSAPIDRERRSDEVVPGSDRISAVIYPYQSATIGTEVRGIIDCINAKEGEVVNQGSVIAEISKERYQAIVGEFKGNYDAVVKSLERARDELAIQTELFDRRATTYDDVQKARSQVQILESRKEEAIHKLKQAELNLKSCIVKAPFTGAISVLYHEPYEAVDNLEKVFGMIDVSKVYARANWPESRLSELSLGEKGQFVYQDKVYEGTIEKISSLIDPASKSKRVHLVINNPDGKLQVGMSGVLTFSGDKKLSMNDSSVFDEK